MSTMISPEDFGAVGDGVTDDTASFAAALTYGAVNLNALYLTPGATYLLDTWTPFNNAGKLVIFGNRAIVKGPSTRVNFLEPDANFEIYDTVFERWQAVIQRLIAASSSFNGVRFQRNEVKDFTTCAVNIERPIQNFWFTDNYVHDGIICAFRIGDNLYASQDTWAHGKISNNIIRNLIAADSQEVDAILALGIRIDICDNDIAHLETEDGPCRGIYPKLRYSLCARNKISDLHSTGSNTEITGINAKGANRDDSDHGVQGFCFTIADNIISDLGQLGLCGEGIKIQMGECKLTGNQFDDGGNWAINFDNQYVSKNITIQNCTINFSDDAHEGTYPTVGIRVTGQGQDVRIDGNIVRNARSGLAVYVVTDGVDSGPLTNLDVANNTFDATVVGIGLRAHQDLEGCRIVNNTVPAASYGIYLDTDSGTISGLYIFGNKLSGTQYTNVPDTAIWYSVGSGLPTSDPSVTGQPWNDSGTVKIS